MMQCTILVLLSLLTCATSELLLPNSPGGRTQPPGTVAFYELGGKCGDGQPAYYGWVEPENGTLIDDKIFLEIMGGAVCFNKSSCEDTWLGAWFSLDKFLGEKLSLPDMMIAGLKLGIAQDFPTLESLRPGYLPTSSAHPLSGRRGIYFPTCTADIMMGRHSLTYEDDFKATPQGGINLGTVLTAVQKRFPQLAEFTVYGGSGGGVSTAIWAGEIAERWPSTDVTAFVDSGFHMMPGSSFFDFYYNHVPWSHGPGGDNAGRIPDVDLPVFDWWYADAMSRMLRKHDGRVKIAYLACNRDYIVKSDREKMTKYSAFNGSEIQQFDEMWGFLTNLHKCSPAGTAYSYLSDCEDHHITRGQFPASADIPGMITAKTFTERFLSGMAPDVNNPAGAMFWYMNRSVSSEGGECSDYDVNGAGQAFPLRSLLLVVLAGALAFLTSGLS